MAFLFQVFLGISWLPITWFYPSEVATKIHLRGQALGELDVYIYRCANYADCVCFFLEMNQSRLEDIDHLFERGGITSGVLGGEEWDDC